MYYFENNVKIYAETAYFYAVLIEMTFKLSSYATIVQCNISPVADTNRESLTN